jgi:hypothetical protein
MNKYLSGLGVNKSIILELLGVLWFNILSWRFVFSVMNVWLPKQ